MALYRFGNASKITTLRVVKDDAGRQTRAYFDAAESASPEELQQLTTAMDAKGWQLVPMVHDGKPVLEVRGFGTDKNLLEILRESKLASFPAQKTATPDDKVSLRARISNATLRASGLAYVIGDFGFFMYGVKGGSWKNSFAAIMYNLGSDVLALFGHADQSPNHIRSASNKLHQLLVTEGHAPQSGSTLEQITRRREMPWHQKTVALLKRYPFEAMSLSFVGAGAGIVGDIIDEKGKDAVTHHKYATQHEQLTKAGQTGTDDYKFIDHQLKHVLPHHRFAKNLDLGLGTMTMASGLAGMVLKEKGDDVVNAPRKGIRGWFDRLVAKPAKITSLGLFISTVCHATSTTIEIRQARDLKDRYNNLNLSEPLADDWKKEKGKIADREQTLWWRALFVVMNLVAEALMFVSSKGHGEGVKADDSVEDTMAAVTAAELAQYDPTRREAMVNRLAGHLATPDVLGGKTSDLSAKIQVQLAALEHNPWKHSMPVSTKTTAAQGPQPLSMAPVLQQNAAAGPAPANRPATQPPSMEKRTSWAKPGERSPRENGWAPQVESDAALAAQPAR